MARVPAQLDFMPGYV